MRPFCTASVIWPASSSSREQIGVPAAWASSASSKRRCQFPSCLCSFFKHQVGPFKFKFQLFDAPILLFDDLVGGCQFLLAIAQSVFEFAYSLLGGSLVAFGARRPFR